MICRFYLILFLFISCAIPSFSQGLLTYYKQYKDSLNTLVWQKTSVKSRLSIKKITPINKTINFYFNDAIEEIPWNKESYAWLKSTLKNFLPQNYKNHSIGEIYFNKHTPLSSIITLKLDNTGTIRNSAHTTNDPRGTYFPLIEKVGGMKFNKGLNDRYLSVWQSHGRYFEEKLNRWEWQRAPNFGTVEDTYTQSYVLPFLIPMLENAGATVLTPRERDTQIWEVITDNDPAFLQDRCGYTRKEGKYLEHGNWTDAGQGFADAHKTYIIGQNPFTMGTARKVKCVPHKATASAVWTPNIPENGEYAVYISYKTLPNSTRGAHYVVNHAKGTTDFIVNQRMGGGTWIYLGTFYFIKGNQGSVVLYNDTPYGRKFIDNSVITADAVKIGGGIGKIARKTNKDTLNAPTTSNLPSYLEGAMYWMQWAGADSTLYYKYDKDYTNDFGTRGVWVNMMSGSSKSNPQEEGKGIPFDLAFALHSDAGITPNDSTIGTLAIYTLKSEGKTKLPNGESRATCRDLAVSVQNQVINDIRQGFNPLWTRRPVWNKSYSECRTPNVPAMILEVLSHQNFADMKLGLDPSFRFAVSRAIYKGILKYLSSRYSCPYMVQPLPINTFSATFHGKDSVKLSWKATTDTLEPTATPQGFMVYTKIGDGLFDNGTIINNLMQNKDEYFTILPLKKNNISSYKIVAYNDGGFSFPSEVLSIGRPKNAKKNKTILVVNNFTRLASPTWFDTPEYAGFNEDLDRGVPYKNDLPYIGKMYQFRRDLPWINDDNPGFGACYVDKAGTLFAGNTYDYTYIHAKAIFNNGYEVESCSAAAFETMDNTTKPWVVDIICGKQITTMIGCGNVPNKYEVYPLPLQNAIKNYCNIGGNIIISGANIGTDVWDKIYPIKIDSTKRDATINFVEKVLGYKWITNYATHTGKLMFINTYQTNNKKLKGDINFYIEPNTKIYNVETPDGLQPSNNNAFTFLRYADTNIGAGIGYNNGTYKIISLGFPIEVIKTEEDIKKIIGGLLIFFNSNN